MAVWAISVSVSELNIFGLAVYGLDDKKLGYITDNDQDYLPMKSSIQTLENSL